MKRDLPIVFFLSLSVFMSAQSPRITGTVVEEESAAKIADAIVTVEGTALVASTDENGEFNFRDSVPVGEHVVSVTKTGYENMFFLLTVIADKQIIVDEVIMELTKKEKKRRKKARKERKAKLKKAEKKDEKQEKELSKEEKKLKKDKKGLFGLGKKKEPEVTVSYQEVDENSAEDNLVVEIITPLQRKYAEILGVAPETITNIELYSFIDKWMGTPYLLGGEKEDGIDCSSFTQRLFMDVNGWYIERTAQKQMDSEDTHTWADPEFLEEGDFVFFRAARDISDTITHVGIYLANNKFINATSRKGNSGISGVKISDLADPYWKKRFFAAGRRVNTKS
ncbi:NlpC/P60 family protein [Pareuzebyella sediminis]|uniref:NlpC/P60 family protein n=1 Tax=Pareuzebyella sediminis TaxID=2607998 RepID=UPI0018E178EB|nr:NlpC/P60 family protein [Pareuzebyella sediminis]